MRHRNHRSQSRHGNRIQQHSGAGFSRGEFGVVTAQDEVGAYTALKYIKKRAQRERDDLQRAQKLKITLPRLKFMEQPE